MQLADAALVRRTALAFVIVVAATAALALSRGEDHGRVVVTDTETTILDVIEFEPGTAVLKPSADAILGAVADTLRGNPSIELVEVQSHTSGIGDAAANQALSDQRAAVLVHYLVQAGVEPARVVAQGYGDTQPLGASPSTNERVSFLILRRSGESADR